MFGILAVLLVIILFLLSFLLLRAREVFAPSSENNNITLSLPSFFSSEKIREQYTLDIGELKTAIQTREQDIGSMLDFCENKMFAMRVPEEHRDTHLQAVLAVSALRDRLDHDDAVVLYQELEYIMSSLNR